MNWDIKGKTVLITGSNSGIGKEAAVALAQRGARVTITSRDAARGKAALDEIRERSHGEVELLSLDLSSFASIRRAAEEFLAAHQRLDVLINNAGLVLADRRQTADGLEMTFGVNHMGPFLFTQLLLDRLIASAPARIINVASDAHRTSRGLPFDNLQRATGYSGFSAYCDSKLANIYFTRELARRLNGKNVTVNALHPGVVASGFGGSDDTSGLMKWLIKVARPFMISAAKGAATTVYLATAPEVSAVSGEYFAKSKPAKPTRVARDDSAAARLWEVSTRLLAAGAQ